MSEYKAAAAALTYEATALTFVINSYSYWQPDWPPSPASQNLTADRGPIGMPPDLGYVTSLVSLDLSGNAYMGQVKDKYEHDYIEMVRVGVKVWSPFDRSANIKSTHVVIHTTSFDSFYLNIFTVAGILVIFISPDITRSKRRTQFLLWNNSFLMVSP